MTARARGGLTIVDALADRRLLGGLPAFRDLSTWGRWLVFLKSVYGLALTDDEVPIFREHTGRGTYRPRDGGWREIVCITGRQSGKTRIAATVAAFEAATAAPEPDGTELYALAVAQDHRGARRALLRYATAPFDRLDMLRPLAKTATADTLALTNGVTLAAYPCRPAAVRGVRAVVAVADELGFFTSTEGNPVDTEMLRALRPTLATTGGRLIVLSSPYGQAGALWEAHRQHFGREDSTTLVWQASAPTMNPLLGRDYLERMRQDDPEAYRSEVLGEFRAGVSTLFDPAALDAVTMHGVREQPPAPGIRYHAFVDVSGGRHDAFVVAIAHARGDLAVLDVLRVWPAPFDPAAVVREAADLLRRYGLRTVAGDKYAAEFTVSTFRANGVRYDASLRDRSAIFLDMVPLVGARRVALLDHARLLRELRGLERHTGTSGRDRVDHMRGAHDDAANAAAGALTLAWSARRSPTRLRAALQVPDVPDVEIAHGRDPVHDLPVPVGALKREF